MLQKERIHAPFMVVLKQVSRTISTCICWLNTENLFLVKQLSQENEKTRSKVQPNFIAESNCCLHLYHMTYILQ